MAPTTPNAEIDAVLDVLSDSWRRAVIRYFENETDDDQISLETLVSYVHGFGTESSRDTVEVGLTHVHLPKLEAQRWLRYRHATREVEYHGVDPMATEVLAILDAVDGEDRAAGTPTL